LNGWIGGFESILKRMTPGNFDWFLHTMLFLQTQYVLKNGIDKASAALEMLKMLKKMMVVMC